MKEEHLSSAVPGSSKTAQPLDLFDLQKIHTVALIAGLLGTRQDAYFTSTTDNALAIFNAAELAVCGEDRPAPTRTRLEQLRLVRLLEKLRAGTLDTAERVELADLCDAGI